MSVNPATLAPLVTRLNNTHAKVKGAPLPVPSSSDVDSLVSSLELITASLTGANPADLAKLTSRLEAALTKIGTKIPPTSTPLTSVEAVTLRLEQLAAAATGAVAPKHAAAAPAPTPAAAVPSVAAAPKVDAAKEKAKVEAEAKAKAEAEAKAKADAEAAKKKKDEEEKKAKEEAEKKKAAIAHTTTPASNASKSVPSSKPTPTPTPAPAAAPAAAKPAAVAAAAPSSAASTATGPAASGPFYSLDQLKGPASSIPAGVTYASRELWLNDTEFVKVLKVTKVEWAKLPGWKKEQAKKAAGLF